MNAQALQKKPEEEAAAEQQVRDRNLEEYDSEEEAEAQMSRGKAGGANGTSSNGAGRGRNLGTVSQRMGLLYGMEDSAGARAGGQGSRGDVEEATETFADRMQ